MIKALFASIILIGLAACATVYKPEVFDNGGGYYSLRLHVGTKGEHLYEENFARKARELCSGEYKVLKKKKWDDGNLEWEVQCHK